jgi:uncharacterized membrane protein SirB2
MEPAAVLAAIVLGAVAVFQLALALGAPWGDHAYGGRAETSDGRLPSRYRLMSALAIPLLLLSGAIILSRAGVVSWFEQDGWVAVAVWVVFAYLVLNTLANFASKSRIERLVLGPATAVAAVCTLIVALSDIA